MLSQFALSELARLGATQVLAVSLAAAAFLALLILAVRRWTRPLPGASLAALTRGPRIVGLMSTGTLVAVFAAWSWGAPLSSAAVAPGVVSPDGYRKTIQHLEGGIIRAIHVKEGDMVRPGDLLVTLDDTISRGRRDEVRERLTHLTATEARLIAEQSGADTIVFPQTLLAASDENARRAMASQVELLKSRRAALEGREKILAQRVLQLDEQNKGLHAMMEAEARQYALIGQEIEASEKLFKSGLERQSRVLDLKQSQAQVEVGQAEHRARIAENDQQIGETRLQLLTLRDDQTERANTELTDVRRQLAELRSQVPARESELTRTEIRAPIAGRVMNLHVTTETGVVRAGEPILDIVPDQTELLIDAQVKPTDIDVVRPGMKTRVLLTAYRQRSLPQIHGVLRSISGDALRDERSGRSYFLAQVEVDQADLAGLDDIKLVPGMPAEVMILSGEQSFLAYLFRPVMESITRSFREN